MDSNEEEQDEKKRSRRRRRRKRRSASHEAHHLRITCNNQEASTSTPFSSGETRLRRRELPSGSGQLSIESGKKRLSVEEIELHLECSISSRWRHLLIGTGELEGSNRRCCLQAPSLESIRYHECDQRNSSCSLQSLELTWQVTGGQLDGGAKLSISTLEVGSASQTGQLYRVSALHSGAPLVFVVRCTPGNSPLSIKLSLEGEQQPSEAENDQLIIGVLCCFKPGKSSTSKRQLKIGWIEATNSWEVNSRQNDSHKELEELCKWVSAICIAAHFHAHFQGKEEDSQNSRYSAKERDEEAAREKVEEPEVGKLEKSSTDSSITASSSASSISSELSSSSYSSEQLCLSAASGSSSSSSPSDCCSSDSSSNCTYLCCGCCCYSHSYSCHTSPARVVELCTRETQTGPPEVQLSAQDFYGIAETDDSSGKRKPKKEQEEEEECGKIPIQVVHGPDQPPARQRHQPDPPQISGQLLLSPFDLMWGVSGARTLSCTEASLGASSGSLVAQLAASARSRSLGAPEQVHAQLQYSLSGARGSSGNSSLSSGQSRGSRTRFRQLGARVSKFTLSAISRSIQLLSRSNPNFAAAATGGGRATSNPMEAQLAENPKRAAHLNRFSASAAHLDDERARQRKVAVEQRSLLLYSHAGIYLGPSWRAFQPIGGAPAEIAISPPDESAQTQARPEAPDATASSLGSLEKITLLAQTIADKSASRIDQTGRRISEPEATSSSNQPQVVDSAYTPGLVSRPSSWYMKAGGANRKGSTMRNRGKQQVVACDSAGPTPLSQASSGAKSGSGHHLAKEGRSNSLCGLNEGTRMLEVSKSSLDLRTGIGSSSSSRWFRRNSSHKNQHQHQQQQQQQEQQLLLLQASVLEPPETGDLPAASGALDTSELFGANQAASCVHCQLINELAIQPFGSSYLAYLLPELSQHQSPTGRVIAKGEQQQQVSAKIHPSVVLTVCSNQVTLEDEDENSAPEVASNSSSKQAGEAAEDHSEDEDEEPYENEDEEDDETDELSEEMSESEVSEGSERDEEERSRKSHRQSGSSLSMSVSRVSSSSSTSSSPSCSSTRSSLSQSSYSSESEIVDSSVGESSTEREKPRELDEASGSSVLAGKSPEERQRRRKQDLAGDKMKPEKSRSKKNRSKRRKRKVKRGKRGATARRKKKQQQESSKTSPMTLQVPTVGSKQARSASLDAPYLLKVPESQELEELYSEQVAGKSSRSRSVDITLPARPGEGYSVLTAAEQQQQQQQQQQEQQQQTDKDLKGQKQQHRASFQQSRWLTGKLMSKANEQQIVKFIQGEIKVACANGETRALKLFVDWQSNCNNGEHLWIYAGSSSEACYVGESECLKHGPRLSCSACKITAHTSCISILINKIKFICKHTFKDLTVSNPRHMKELQQHNVIYHHWVHKRTHCGKCKQCTKTFGNTKLPFSSKEIQAITCSWCKVSYHNKENCYTLSALTEPCTLGAHRESIIPPTWIIKVPTAYQVIPTSASDATSNLVYISNDPIPADTSVDTFSTEQTNIFKPLTDISNNDCNEIPNLKQGQNSDYQSYSHGSSVSPLTEIAAYARAEETDLQHILNNNNNNNNNDTQTNYRNFEQAKFTPSLTTTESLGTFTGMTSALVSDSNEIDHGSLLKERQMHLQDSSNQYQRHQLKQYYKQMDASQQSERLKLTGAQDATDSSSIFSDLQLMQQQQQLRSLPQATSGLYQNFKIVPHPIQGVPNAGAKPVLVFVNPRSGGNQGAKMMQKFNWLLNPRQVFDLIQSGGPRAALELYKDVPNLRILTIGGDGTASWILSYLDEVGIPNKIPVAVLPLGTGNDLARALGWGGGYADEPIAKILTQVRDGEIVQLDRWNLEVERNLDESPSSPNEYSTNSFSGCQNMEISSPSISSSPSYFGSLSQNNNTASTISIVDQTNCDTTTNQATVNPISGYNGPQDESGSDKLPMDVINNYFSFGVDAHIALEFHTAREAHPERFSSRLRNKMFYGQAGGKDLLRRKWKDLSNFVTLYCDGQDMTNRLKELKVHSVLFLNIQSYGGGTRPWPTTATSFTKPRTDDGLIEVIGLTTYQLPLLQAGGHGTCIAQCRRAKIITTRTIPMQVDGEPCQLLPSIINISFKNRVCMLAKSKSSGKNTNYMTSSSMQKIN